MQHQPTLPEAPQFRFETTVVLTAMFYLLREKELQMENV